MNPVAIVHLLAALVVLATAVPLIRGKVKRNIWYGVRIPEAFASEARWLEINRYGGRLLFYWGLVVAAAGIAGAFLEGKHWIVYNWIAAVIVLGSFALVAVKIQKYARK